MSTENQTDQTNGQAPAPEYDQGDPALAEAQAMIDQQQAAGEAALAREQESQPDEQAAEAAAAAQDEQQIGEQEGQQQAVEYDDTSYSDDLPEGADQVANETQVADEQIPAGGGEASETPAGDVEFPEYLLNAAGIDADTAKARFGSPDALQAAVRMLDERFIQTQPQYVDPRQQRQQVAPTRQQPVADDTSGKARDEFKLPELPEGQEWDEDTLKLVSAMNQHYQGRLQAQDDYIRKQGEAVQAMLSQKTIEDGKAYVQAFDNYIEGLGEDWKSTFGEGSGFELPNDSLFMQNRKHLDLTAQQLKAGLASQGKELSREDLLARALAVAFPDTQKETVRREVTQQITKRKSMQVARPTARRSQPLTGDEAAAKHAEKWYADRGMAVTDDEWDYSMI